MITHCMLDFFAGAAVALGAGAAGGGVDAGASVTGAAAGGSWVGVCVGVGLLSCGFID